MGLDSLFERLVIATERIANAMEGATVKLQVGAVEPTCAAAGKGKRGAKKGDDAAPVVETATTVVETATAKPTNASKAPPSFLLEDDEAPVVEEKPVLTIDVVRKALIGLQKATDPDTAFKVLIKASGGTQSLQSLSPDKFEAVLEAIEKATPKKAA